MKLDNIIYDTNTLQDAITEQWTKESSAFQAIFPSNTATELAKTFAAYGSMLQYLLVSTMANCYTKTAFSEAGIYQLADTLGNNLHGNISSQVKVNLRRVVTNTESVAVNPIGLNIVIPQYSVFEIDSKKFFNPEAIMLPAGIEVVSDIVLVQGEFLEVLKTTSGIENEKIYFASDFLANNDYVSVLVNGVNWPTVDSFIPYDQGYIVDPEAMNAVMLRTDPDGRSYIRFGNNQLGTMPASGSNVLIRYVSNNGIDGNISEVGKIGALTTQIEYTASYGKTETLNLEVETTTTANGGAAKQSMEILRETSPYVFASGNRAVRRQDYKALLLNKCGYSTCNIWGEYEQAARVGAADSIMMNMVYYTGIKIFQTYPYYHVDTLTDAKQLSTVLNSVSGFWGSFAIKVQNNYELDKAITFQDTGAKGLLFINNNTDDPRDSILPDWKDGTVKVTTNEDESGEDLGYRTILDARSDQIGSDKYYQSNRAPSLLQPIQIIFEFDSLRGKSISAIKFKAAEESKGPFIGAMSLFGADAETRPSLYNVRNNEAWDCLISRTTPTNPIRNNNENWTDWMATNVFDATQDVSQNVDQMPIFKSYKFYVLEIYSTAVNNISDLEQVTFDKFKLQYIDDASLIFYDNNGKIDLRFPVAGDPGPNVDNPDAGLADSLINELNFPIYSYNTTVAGVTASNGYQDGNILAYVFKGENGKDILFKVEALNISNGQFKITKTDTGVMAGNEYISLQEPGSLDAAIFYKHSLVLENGQLLPEDRGIDYRLDDIVAVDGSDGELLLRVVSRNDLGEVLSLVWENDLTLNKSVEGHLNTTLVKSTGSGIGTGLRVNVNSIKASGAPGIEAQGGTIDITSNYNLEIAGSYAGNRVDTADINAADQHTLNQYNHFTTYIEYVQPEVVQVEVAVDVEIEQSNQVTSSAILTAVKNNVYALFDITPEYMGKGIYLSDIYSAVTKTPGVKNCLVKEPLSNVEINENALIICSNVTVNEIYTTYN